MAFTIKQVKAKLQGYGVPNETLDKAAEELCAAHKTDLDAIIEERDKFKADAEKLEAVQKELDGLKAAGDGGLQKQNDDLQKQLSELQTKYTTDTEALQKQISDRDYTDAINEAIKSANDGKGLKFTSKGKETAFISALRQKGLELKDGVLDKGGFDAFLKADMETDPDGFVSDTPTPKIVSRIGTGGAPTPPKSRAAELAAKYNQNLYGVKKE